MKIFIPILFLLNLKSISSAGQNGFQDSLFNKFKNDVKLIQQENSGVFISDDETLETFYSLLAYSTLPNLIKFTNDDNPYIRSEFYRGILSMSIKSEKIKRILELHKNDSSKFTLKGGCVVTEWTVSNYMNFCFEMKLANKLKPINFIGEINKIKRKPKQGFKIEGLSHGMISKSDILKLDSLILYDKNIAIESFSFYLNDKNINSTSNKITHEMKVLLENAKPGDYLLFEQPKVFVKKYNIIRTIDSIKIKIL